MNHEIIDEVASGEVSMRVVKLEGDDANLKKYWLKAGAGHLEFDEDGIDDLMDVLFELHSGPDNRRYELLAPMFFCLLAFIIGVILATAVIV